MITTIIASTGLFTLLVSLLQNGWRRGRGLGRHSVRASPAVLCPTRGTVLKGKTLLLYASRARGTAVKKNAVPDIIYTYDYPGSDDQRHRSGTFAGSIGLQSAKASTVSRRAPLSIASRWTVESRMGIANAALLFASCPGSRTWCLTLGIDIKSQFSNSISISRCRTNVQQGDHTSVCCLHANPSSPALLPPR